jgi:hypothetical protein
MGWVTSGAGDSTGFFFGIGFSKQSDYNETTVVRQIFGK